MKGEQKRVGQRNASSLCCWLETDERFHVSESKGPLHGPRRRGARTISSSRCSSSAQGGRFSSCSTRFLGSAEAGSGVVPSSHSFVSFESLSLRVESPSSRVQCVTAALDGHHNACDTHNSQYSNSVHGACGVLNSENSLGDTEAGRQRFCVPGGTKSLSTSTRCGVRHSAVFESAHPQQTPLKLHEETWAGLLRNKGPKIFQEVEIVPGCAVQVACSSCPDYSPEPPGPGRIIRNMLAWSQLEKTERSGAWVFRGALQGENFLFPCRSWRLGTKEVVPQRGRSAVIPHALVHMRMGMAPLSGHTLESGAGHC